MNGAPKVLGAGALQDLKVRMHRRLLDSLDLVEAQRLPQDQLAAECSRKLDSLLTEERTPLSAPERRQLLRDLLDEIFGLGPLEEFLRDPTISDILINGPDQVYLEREGRLVRATSSFRDSDHLLKVIQRIGSQVGRRIDESTPMMDARLADGSRVNAIIPPLALDGPTVSIRRFGVIPIDAAKLIEFQAFTPEMAQFLEASVKSRINILLAGGTGAGKTTLLNVLSRWIPAGERVVTIEDAAELRLQRQHVVRLETRPPNIEGRGEVTQRDLLRNTLRMRPDRIIIGEVRGAEALDMMQAMNTGHEGSMTTVHANTGRDAIRRVENMISMAGLNYPVTAIRQQMASAINLVVHVARMTGGRRKVQSVMEVTGMEGDTVCLQEIFKFRQTGVGPDGHALGQFEGCGIRPRIMDRIEAEGTKLPATLFERRPLPFPKGSP
ncbi:MAG TPA: CpaF family protein [Phycisphaerales bacterium]|nr:CpaF family protein [Phycisphaerales bacterium]